MRVLLLAAPLSYPEGMNIQPRHPPYVLLSTAASLEAVGVEVQVYDAFLEHASASEIAAAVRAARFDLIGLAPLDLQRFPPVEVAIQLACDLLRQHPETPLVVFGIRSDKMIDRILREAPGIACALIGDPEEMMVEVVQAFASHAPLDRIEGLRQRKPDSELAGSSSPRMVHDLDRLPTPAWHLVDLRRYAPPPHRTRQRRIYPIMVTRSCPWNQCIFCQELSTHKLSPYRMRSPGHVAEEIARESHDGEELDIHFLDSTLPIDQGWLDGFGEEVRRRKLSFIWLCLTRADQLSPRTVNLMRDLGCWNISFGIESSSQRTLDTLQKGITTQQVRQTVAWCREAGITTTGTFLLGLPHERPRDVIRTALFAVDIGLDFVVFFISKWFEKPEELRPLGTFLDEWDYSTFDFRGPPFIPNAYRDLNHLRRTQTLAHLLFYGHPKTLLRRLQAFRTLDDVENSLAGLRTLLKVVS